ncbi:MAG: hypothetical protein AAF630_08060 [Cyanobacteria bacterium P01_C01_bin.38]
MSRMKPEVAQRRIESFAKRFGKGHLYLAYHAAFPLTLTPDLLYGLWIISQKDVHKQILDIPWIAVGDLLLSALCDEVGHELYEMDLAVRNQLLRGLQSNECFGKQRINQLSNFLLEYLHKQLLSNDPDIQDFAKIQRWIALAYTKPSQAARELALAFSKIDEWDKPELLRMASLMETFTEPLSEFQPLLIYARGMGKFAHGDLNAAKAEFREILKSKRNIQIAEVSLPIPEEIKKQSVQTNHFSSLNISFILVASIINLSLFSSSVLLQKPLPTLPNFPLIPTPSSSNREQEKSEFAIETSSTEAVAEYAIQELRLANINSGLKAVEELLNRNALSNAETALENVEQEQINNPYLNFVKGRLAWQLIQKGDTRYRIDDTRRYWEVATQNFTEQFWILNPKSFISADMVLEKMVSSLKMKREWQLS